MEAWCIIQPLSLPQCLQNIEGKIYLEEMQEDVPEFGEEEEDADVLLQDKDFNYAQQVPPNNYGDKFLPHNAKPVVLGGGCKTFQVYQPYLLCNTICPYKWADIKEPEVEHELERWRAENKERPFP